MGPSSKCRATEVSEPDRPDRRGAPRRHASGSTCPDPSRCEEDQAARRATEVVHPRDGLLAAVAALVQVHRGPQPVDLVDDRAVVGLEPGSRPPRGDAQRLGGPHARQRPVADGRLERRRAARSAPASAAASPGWFSTGPYAAVSPTRDGQGSSHASGSPATDSLAWGSPSTAYVTADVADLHPQHEPHRVQPCLSASPAPGSVVTHAVSPSSTRCRS